MDKKIIITGTILMILTFLIGSVYFPDSVFMLFASNTIDFIIVRAALIALLGVVLFTNPPRQKAFRVVLGMFAISLAISSVYLATHYLISIVDTIIFMQTAIIFGMEALETNGLAQRSARPIIVRSSKIITNS